MTAAELAEVLEMADNARRAMEMMDMMKPQRNLRWDTALEISRVESTVGSETRVGRILALLSRELERDWIVPFVQGGESEGWKRRLVQWEAEKAAVEAAERNPGGQPGTG